MPCIKWMSLVIHVGVIISFVSSKPLPYFLMTIGLVFHILFLKKNSQCTQGHCHSQMPKSLQNTCEVCGLPKWIRMRHCYKCQRCVHKYDHHCFLMGQCVGEFNHKYYIGFLYSYLVNNLIMVLDFHHKTQGQVTLQQNGIEQLTIWFYIYTIALILLYFNTFLALFLTCMHTYLLCTNQTTWETHKRDQISYLKRVRPQIKAPFSKGILTNLKQCFTTDPQQPIQWKIKI